MEASVITLLFLLFAVVMFVWEKIPLGVTSMIVCIGLVVTGVLDWKTAFAGFVDSNVILFVAMFIVGGALFETGMANKIGGVVTHFAKSEKQLIIAIMIITGVMSGVLSNTGTAAVLIPVVIGIAAKSGYSRSRLLMPLVFAAAMGGNLSLIGAPGNLIAQSAMEDMGKAFGFFEYAKVGLPILITGTIFFALFGYKLLPEHKGGETLSLASALEETGAGEMIADKVIGLLGANPSPYLLTFVVFMLCCVLTNFMSNTATTALMVPICVSIANRMGADPSAVLMACVIGGSCAYATPIGMPANTMVVTAGGYTFKDYAKAGIPLILVATVVSMILLPVLYPFFP